MLRVMSWPFCGNAEATQLKNVTDSSLDSMQVDEN